MEDDATILKEVETTLQAFDNDVVLEGNPFLATRILAEREARKRRYPFGIITKARVRYAAVVLLLLVNLVTAAYYYERNDKNSLQDKLVSELQEDYYIDPSQDDF